MIRLSDACLFRFLPVLSGVCMFFFARHTKNICSHLAMMTFGFICISFLGTSESFGQNPLENPDDNISFSQGSGAAQAINTPKSEAKTVHGHRSPLPMGYQDAPSMEIEHGDDPDHLAKVHRDPVTGADLSKYGTAYQTTGPFGGASMGDSTGNGWVIPR